MDKDYESSFRELEKIIRELESKDISLEDSIKKYEEGIELYKYLNKTLKAYEGKIKTIAEENSDFLEDDKDGKYR
ncbi:MULTISPECIES: exodeoxyribonuclease VII small subunit [Peptoniphilus]|jgi:exonuclease VII small subunit|uniref:exodeoxyribonuclease VII small subunit n=1 Tax=Peptoniphilus TaxID=162289 RepID=UPI0002896926|nr:MULTISPECIES: exodeoxyribonuclease VII small subunit [Peptoniphilus]MBS6610128.1 exodeoxyribonuclease VII small subunit [Peptoniphilus harei]MDU4681435.1 exodeoxyribonuclease VII small subunit [Cutibacterium avidum]MDU1043382.1 exodeoxyribonuclease VII small subunit [Peptoniphilus rhinitidis]MDU1954098.1 exodeoxyribonuclease VII small subunit [Peptoniphilus lacydonensis]MDU2109565.1 exodeoxyribonuclease VII small subunit [Peptoniphilus lacydonensis]